MATSDVPVTSLPTPAAPATAAAKPAASNDANTANGAGDFVTMLADIMNASGASPQAILDAIKTVQAAQKSTKEDAAIDPSVLLLDPSAILSLLANTIQTAAKATGSSSIDTDARRGDSTPLDLTLLTSIAKHGEGDLSDSLLATTNDAHASDKSNAHADAQRTDVGVNAVQANVTNDRVADVQERPQIRAHVGTPAWTDELAGKLTVMIGRGVHSASLQLSPEQLGPLEIHISVNNDQTSVWFGAAHAETRTALEQALPRLRELLAGQGLNLSDAGVSREAPRDRAKPYAPTSNARDDEREFAVAAIGVRGIVDAYA